MFEKLELRRLLSSSLSNGVLTITGSPAGDSLVAEQNGQHIHVVENSTKITKFKANKVNHIVFHGLGGNDALNKRSNKPSIMNGGEDNDIMIGSPTAADEFRGGDGVDTVSYAARTQDLRLGINIAAGANNGDEGDLLSFDLEQYVGGSGNDQISASDNSEILEGGPGNDILFGGTNSDILIGGSGDDVLDGGLGNDQLQGGPGKDVFDGGDDSDDMNGGEGDDRYVQSVRFAPSLDATTDFAGIDTLDFSGSFTKFDVDMAMDVGQVQELADDALARLTGVFENAIGGPFSSTIRGNDADNILDNRRAFFDGFVDGRGGNDWLIGSPFVDDNMFGGNGDDRFDGLSTGKDGSDHFDGGPGFDTLDLSLRSNALRISTDSSAASFENDGESNEKDDVKNIEHLIGGGGDDFFSLGDAAVTNSYWFEGRSGNDDLFNDSSTSPGTGRSTLQGGDGDDFLLGGSGNDLLEGGAGSDVLDAVDGNDVLEGGEDNDTLFGGAGNDTLNGGAGSDRLFGGSGDDLLIANDGESDEVDGGSGGETLGDTAIFDAALDIVTNCENTRTAFVPADRLVV